MAFQPIPNTAEVVLRFVRGVDPTAMDWPVINVHHWRRALGWGAADLAALNTEIEAWWEAELKPETHIAFRLYDIKSTNMHVEFGASSTLVVNEAGTSGSSGSQVAVQSAVVQWQCDPGGAPRRGRTYFGCLGEPDIEADTISSAKVAALDAAYEELRNVDASGTAALVIPSRFSGFTLVNFPDGTVRKVPTKRNPALTNTIASVSVRSIIGVQERRRRG